MPRSDDSVIDLPGRARTRRAPRPTRPPPRAVGPLAEPIPAADGLPLDRALAGTLPWRRWPLVERALDAAAELVPGAAGPMGRPVHRGWVSLVDAVDAVRDDLRNLGVDRALTAELAAHIRQAGGLPAIPQHGDLRPANVRVTSDETIRILGCGGLGTIRIPLFDAFHLLRSLGDASPFADPRPWCERLLGSRMFARRNRRLLARERARRHLDHHQVGMCLVGYVLLAPALTERRGGGTERGWRLRLEIPALAAMLRRTGDVEALGARITSLGRG